MSQENVEIVRAAIGGDAARRLWTPGSDRMRPQILSLTDSSDAGESERGVYRAPDEVMRTCGRSSSSPGSLFAERLMSSSTLASAWCMRHQPATLVGRDGIEVEAGTGLVLDVSNGAVDSASPLSNEPDEGPRSRRAGGVGDVAGERGDRAGGPRRLQPGRR